MGKKRINDEKIWRPDVLLVERGSIVKGTVETTEEHLTLPGDIPDSPINHMGKDLADRTLYLKEELEMLRKYVDDVLACIQACSTGCKDTCLDMCLDTCKDGCKGTCKETCSTTCKGSCVDTCSGTCKGGCGDVCSGGCGNSCSTNCSTQCSGTCTQTCGGNCVGACVTGCSGCKGSCEGGCLTGCYTTCTGSCNTACTTSCAAGCANNCAADCGGGCKNTCNNTCNNTNYGVVPTPTTAVFTLIWDATAGLYNSMLEAYYIDNGTNLTSISYSATGSNNRYYTWVYSIELNRPFRIKPILSYEGGGHDNPQTRYVLAKLKGTTGSITYEYVPVYPGGNTTPGNLGYYRCVATGACGLNFSNLSSYM